MVPSRLRQCRNSTEKTLSILRSFLSVTCEGVNGNGGEETVPRLDHPSSFKTRERRSNTYIKSQTPDLLLRVITNYLSREEEWE